MANWRGCSLVSPVQISVFAFVAATVISVRADEQPAPKGEPGMPPAVAPGMPQRPKGQPKIAFSVRTLRPQFAAAFGEYTTPGESACSPATRETQFVSVDLVSQVVADNSIPNLDLSATVLIKEWNRARSRNGSLTFANFVEEYGKTLRAHLKSKSTSKPMLWNIAVDVDKPLFVGAASGAAISNSPNAAEIARFKTWTGALSKLGTECISIRVDVNSNPHETFQLLSEIRRSMGKTTLLVENGEISSMEDFEAFAAICAAINGDASSESEKIGTLLNFGAVRFRSGAFDNELFQKICGCLTGVRISSAVYGTPDLIGVDSDRRLFTEGLKCLSDRDVVISIECLGPQVKATKKLYPGIGMLKTDLEAGLAGNAPADFLPSNPN